MQTIGERIKIIRKNFGVNQRDFGKLIGVKPSAVSKLECGRANPTEAAIKLICATYRINYLWLTEGTGPMMQEETAEDMVERVFAGESPLTIQIMKAFVRLPDEDWHYLRDGIDYIKKNGPL